MSNVIPYHQYEAAAKRWGDTERKELIRMHDKVMAESFGPMHQEYESSIGIYDAAPCEMNCDSGDCA